MSKEEKYYSFQDILKVIGFDYEFKKRIESTRLIEEKTMYTFPGDR